MGTLTYTPTAAIAAGKCKNVGTPSTIGFCPALRGTSDAANCDWREFQRVNVHMETTQR